MHERSLTDVTSVPSRIRPVTPAAAVSVGTAPNHVRSRGPVIHIEDVDPESIGAGRYRGHSDPGSVAEADLAPGAVVVSAAVVLGFAIVAS